MTTALPAAIGSALLARARPRELPAVRRSCEKRELDWATVLEHLDLLYRVAVSLCGSPHDAQDLVHETCIRVLSRPRRVDAGGARPYLVASMRNVFLDGLRKRARRSDVTAFDDHARTLASDSASPHDVAEAREVLAVVAQLPEPFRDVIAAVDVAGLTYPEAARVLGIPIGTVMSRLHRARVKVAATLDAGRR